jgi:hypothetical protein
LWMATKRQAPITRAMFEASHRPYLNVILEDPQYEAAGMVCVVRVQNQGTVPAVITRWRVTARLANETLAVDPSAGDAPRAVCPGTHERLVRAVVTRPPTERLPRTILVEAVVMYRGVGTRDYSTRIVMEQATSREGRTSWECREVRLDA